MWKKSYSCSFLYEFPVYKHDQCSIQYTCDCNQNVIRTQQDRILFSSSASIQDLITMVSEALCKPDNTIIQSENDEVCSLPWQPCLAGSKNTPGKSKPLDLDSNVGFRCKPW